MTETVYGYVINTLNGWAALTMGESLIGYYADEKLARAAVQAFSRDNSGSAVEATQGSRDSNGAS